MILSRRHTSKNEIRIIIMSLICTFGINASVSAKLPETLILHGYSRAVYQICLLEGIPVTYKMLRYRMTNASADPMQKSVDLLEKLGFRVKKQNITLNEIALSKRGVIIMGENEYPVVAHIQDKTYNIIDYPLPPKLVNRAEFTKLWPRQAIVIQDVPKMTDNNSGLTLQPYAIDFKVLDEGDIYKDSFQIRNALSVPVTIMGFKSSCGCARIVTKNAVGKLAPGESRDMDIEINSKSTVGYQEFLFLVKTDRGGVVFKVSGYVRAGGVYYPKEIDFGTLCQSESTMSKMVCFLGYAVSGANPVISVKTKSPLSYVIHREMNSAWNVTEDRLVITLDPQKAELGALSSSVRVKYRKNEKILVADLPVLAKIVLAKSKSSVFNIRDSIVGKELTKEFNIAGVDRKTVSDLQRGAAYGDIEVSWAENHSKCILVVKTTMAQVGVAERVIKFTETRKDLTIHHTIYLTIVSRKEI